MTRPSNSLGGYESASRVTSKNFNNVKLPDKIKCSTCKKIKNQAAYSQKQINELTWKIFREGGVAPTVGIIKCRQCTGQQVTELTCCICEEVRGLDAFSKAQRRNRDMARCLDCVRIHESTEPDVIPPSDTEDLESSDGISNPYGSGEDEDDDESDDDSEDDDDDDESDDSDTHPEGASEKFSEGTVDVRNLTLDSLTLAQMTGGVRSRSGRREKGRENTKPSARSPSTVVSSTLDDDGSVLSSTATGGWVTQSRHGRGRKSVASTSYTGYDAQGQGHHRTTSPSSVSSKLANLSVVSGESSEQGSSRRQGNEWASIKISRQLRDQGSASSFVPSSSKADQSRRGIYDLAELPEW